MHYYQVKILVIQVQIKRMNNPTENDIIIACRMAVRYSKGKDEESVEVKFGRVSTNFSDKRLVDCITQEELDKYNIN